MNDSSQSDTCRTTLRGRLGVITLERRSALNALNLDMIEALHAALDDIATQHGIELILIRSTSDKAYCAGGDMKRIRELALAERYDEIHAFFDREYALNLRLATSPKPVMALVDGIAMGGGLGISVHGRYCVVSERSLFGMPESRIGFFPDVGGTHFLPRLPKRAGWWMACTAESVTGPMAVRLGLASHLIASDTLEHFVAALEDTSAGSIDEVVGTFCKAREALPDDPATEATLDARAAWFADASSTASRERLAAAATGGNTDAATLLDKLDGASPHTLAVIETLFDDNATASLEAALARELEQSAITARHPDFIEGVRAVLVDKDRNPKWVER
ncbi:MAG: enoyl-CoA hydratase [Gammaproteobacteria bacterium]|nr:MAG: enoyl-CoA hydratase [Gammaproteobacteria bacterium]